MKVDYDSISAKDFQEKVEEIMEVVLNCSITQLSNLFKSAMEAQGAEQDMSTFEPMTLSYCELFIRQIKGAISMFDYETLAEFHTYTLNLVKIKKEN